MLYSDLPNMSLRLSKPKCTTDRHSYRCPSSSLDLVRQADRIEHGMRSQSSLVSRGRGEGVGNGNEDTADQVGKGSDEPAELGETLAETVANVKDERSNLLEESSNLWKGVSFL